MARLSFDDFAATVLLDPQQSFIQVINSPLEDLPGETVTFEFFYDGGSGAVSGTTGRARFFNQLWKTITISGSTVNYSNQPVPAFSTPIPAVPNEGKPKSWIPATNPSNPAVNEARQLYNAGSGQVYWWGKFDITFPDADLIARTTTYNGEIQLTD